MDTWGLCFGPAWQTSVVELLEPARAAEQAGFDRLATGEYRNDAITWMATLAAATTAIPVATTIASIALRHPTVVAEAVAAMRDVYGDRIELGLGVSHSTVVTEDLGLDLPTLSDLESYVMTVRAVLDGIPISIVRHRAPAHDRLRTETSPAPILVAALGEAAASRAARYADGIILTWSPSEWTRHIAKAVRHQDAERGRATRIWVVLPTFTTDDARVAREACARHLRPYLGLPSYRNILEMATADPARIESAASSQNTDRQVADALGSDLIESVSAIGTRDGVTAAVASTYEAGADAVILYPLDTGSGWREAVEATIRRCAPPA